MVRAVWERLPCPSGLPATLMRMPAATIALLFRFFNACATRAQPEQLKKGWHSCRCRKKCTQGLACLWRLFLTNPIACWQLKLVLPQLLCLRWYLREFGGRGDGVPIRRDMSTVDGGRAVPQQVSCSAIRPHLEEKKINHIPRLSNLFQSAKLSQKRFWHNIT